MRQRRGRGGQWPRGAARHIDKGRVQRGLQIHLEGLRHVRLDRAADERRRHRSRRARAPRARRGWCEGFPGKSLRRWRIPVESAAPVVALEDEGRLVGCGEQLEHTLRHQGAPGGWRAPTASRTQLGPRKQRREVRSRFHVVFVAREASLKPTLRVVSNQVFPHLSNSAINPGTLLLSCMLCHLSTCPCYVHVLFARGAGSVPSRSHLLNPRDPCAISRRRSLAASFSSAFSAFFIADLPLLPEPLPVLPMLPSDACRSGVRQ